jgi:hypothetical protein
MAGIHRRAAFLTATLAHTAASRGILALQMRRDSVLPYHMRVRNDSGRVFPVRDSSASLQPMGQLWLTR